MFTKAASFDSHVPKHVALIYTKLRCVDGHNLYKNLLVFAGDHVARDSVAGGHYSDASANEDNSFRNHIR